MKSVLQFLVSSVQDRFSVGCRNATLRDVDQLRDLFSITCRSGNVSFSHLHEDKTAEWWMKNVLFSDESMVELHSRRPYYIRRPVSSRHHPRYIYPRYHHPLKVMVWGCFAACGVASIEILRPHETVNSNRSTGLSRFFEIIFLFRWLGVKRQCLCKTMLLRTRAEQHDNGYKKTASQFSTGNSADLKPIENLWSVLKASVCQKNVKNKAEFHTVIQEA
jgi:hypothetical protein